MDLYKFIGIRRIKLRKRKRQKGVGKYGLLCMMVVFLSYVIGVGYANWNDRIIVDTTICTGFMDPVFCNAEIVSKSKNVKVKRIKINGDQKSMNLSLDNVRKGDFVKMRYKVKNLGSIPVYCKVENQLGDSVAIRVTGTKEAWIGSNGNTGEAVVQLVINEVQPAKTYTFPIHLVFRQYNMLEQS